MDIESLKIKRASYDDCPLLATLKREVWETTYRGIYPDEKIDNYDYDENVEKFKSYIDNENNQLYVVFDNDELIGYIEFGSPLRPFGDYTQEIGLLYLRKDHQRQGLGTKLFNLASENIKVTGTDRFFISCHKYNLGAQEFYKKMGGEIVAVDDDSANEGLPQIKFEYKI